MKKVIFLSASFLLIQVFVSGQNSNEARIRQLEQLEIESIHKADTATLLKIWNRNYVCNNPYGVIVTVPEILGFIRAGEIDYSTTERIVERITFTNNIAIAMGKEIVKPQNKTPNAGKTITMRYTHVYVKTTSGWLLSARQATNFSVE